MKILEVRDGFIKFEADSTACLSSFIQISGQDKHYIAQIINIKYSGIKSIATAKILFLYDGNLRLYDKTLPPDDAEIKDFTFNILNNSINASEPVIAGIMPGKDLNIIIDASSFDKKMLISIDDKIENNILIRNFTKQFNNLNKKVLIIDTLGVINAKKYTAGIDFKLPLDTASLSFMYQDCLNDATADSKSLIIEIFKELAEYSRTVEFVPFGTLKNIVDDMVDKSHIFKLLVLKNKLAKFDKTGYFANNKDDVDKINKILDSKCAIIDLSDLDSSFQNRYLAFLYEKLQEKNDTQVFLELSNTISKKNLKNILEASVPTTFITHSRFKYLNDVKNLFDNFIISPSETNNEIFKVYNTLLKALPKQTYLIAGEAVNYMPIVSAAKLIDEVIPVFKEEEQPQQNIIEESEEDSLNTELTPEEQTNQTSQEENSSETVENNITTTSESPAGISELEDENDSEVAEPVIIDNANITEESEKIINNTSANEEQKPEIVEPEIVNTIEAPEIEENKISNEEILANITEKSEAVISDAAKNLVQPTGSMFEDDEPDEIQETEPENKSTTEEYLTQENSEDTVFEELESAPEITENNIIVSELADNTGLDDSDLSISHTLEVEEEEELGIPPEEAFDENIEPAGEIQDYIQDNDTILLQDESEDVFDNDETKPKELEASSIQDEDFVTIPDDLDIDTDQNDYETLEEVSETEEEINTDIQEEIPELDDIVELDPADADENDILVDIEEEDDDDDTNILDNISEEELDSQIVKDVDKVFTTRKDDDISDSDLDFIDELNSDEELLEEPDDGILEEIPAAGDDDILEESAEPIKLKEDEEILETRNTTTPIVPVYDADIPQEDLVISDPIEQGDSVIHAKYGNGIVEKMIKYGNKTLCSINFEIVGGRLLDPTLTEIKKA